MGSTLYVALNHGGGYDDGTPVQLSSATLALLHTSDPVPGVFGISTASPTVGPDGNVYYGNASGPDHGGSCCISRKTSRRGNYPAPLGGIAPWPSCPPVVCPIMLRAAESTYFLFSKHNSYRYNNESNKIAISGIQCRATRSANKSNGHEGNHAPNKPESV